MGSTRPSRHVEVTIYFNKPSPRNGFLRVFELEYAPFLSLLCPWRLDGLRAGRPGFDSRQGQVFSFWSVLWLLLSSDNNEVVFSFWSALSLLLGSDNNAVVFYFWPVPRLLPEEDVRCSLLSERPQESGYILEKTTRSWPRSKEVQKPIQQPKIQFKNGKQTKRAVDLLLSQIWLKSVKGLKS
jgi:hypothetical protein